MTDPIAQDGNAPAPRRRRPTRAEIAGAARGWGAVRAILSGMLLGPMLALVTPSAILVLALGELGNILAGQRQGLAVGEQAAAAVVLLPAAWLIGFPAALAWLRWPWGGYLGALFQGGLMGLGWAALGTHGAQLWRAERLGLTQITPPGLSDILTNAALVGIPLGMATAAAFWISLERRAGGSRRRVGIRLTTLLLLAWVQFALVAALGAYLG